MFPAKIYMGQITAVLGIVVVSTWAATQWTAAALGFQERLGAPWFLVAGYPIYLPWRLSTSCTCRSLAGLRIDDDDPDTLARASVISAYMVGDSEAEIEMADRAVALNPNSFYTGYYRGHVYRIAGLPEDAIRSFERAIRMSPVDPRLHMTFEGIGLAFIELRRFDEAIVVLKKALRHNPSYVRIYRCLASAFAHLGRDAEAREAAARVLETEPAYKISAWIARGGQPNAKLFIEGLRKAGLPE